MSTETPTVPPRPGGHPIRVQLESRLRSGALELPLLPAVASQVMAICNDEECDMRTLSELIQQDQSLAANVLRVANSALYTSAEPIVSLHQAVSRLGIAAMCDMAMAVAVRGRVFGVPGREELVARLWRHSVLTAAYAQEIARMRRANVEGAFLGGLLHDVGRPLVLQTLVDIAGVNGEELQDELLDTVLSELHLEVGGILAREWGLPDFIQHAVVYHHDPECAPANTELARTVCLADLLAHWVDDEGVEPPIAHPVLGPLSLYQEDVEDLLALRERVAQRAEALA